MSDEVSIAKTEAIFREVNEAIAKTAGKLDADETEFVCECGDADCAHRIKADLDDYERVRRHATRFIIAPGHDQPKVERVLRTGKSYSVVEKSEQTVVRIVRKLNPRAKPKPA
jgi:hypothetical protein